MVRWGTIVQTDEEAIDMGYKNWNSRDQVLGTQHGFAFVRSRIPVATEGGLTWAACGRMLTLLCLVSARKHRWSRKRGTGRHQCRSLIDESSQNPSHKSDWW